MGEVIWVADRGCVAPRVLDVLDGSGVRYVVGTRMRKVKEVLVGGHRYVVCYDPETGERDKRVRGELIKLLMEDLRSGGSGLIQRGYRRETCQEKCVRSHSSLFLEVSQSEYLLDLIRMSSNPSYYL